MILHGKKIGFALTIGQLGDTRILREIEKIMLQGAELFIILFSEDKKEEEILLTRFKRIFQYINMANYGLDARPDNLDYPFLDLLVVIPCSKRFLSVLEKIVPEKNCNLFPLVLVPAIDNDLSVSLSSISALMKKKGIYFVPFGPVNSKENKNGTASFYSRIDLLPETCAAALEGRHLKPTSWENHFFPG
jgi:dipicolinate synthase subunit B